MQFKHKLSLEQFLDLSVKGWVFYLFFVFLTTELLSLFNLISRTSIIIIYSIVALSSLVFLFKNKIIIDLNSLKRIGKSEKFILLVITLTILLPILFTALYYPPNNWDSMTYHMARIMHWIDNKDVNFYFTQNDRQLFSGPLAEYVILHWYLLVDSDIFSNLVQYFSLIVTTCASYLITKFLSKDKKINLLSIVLVLTTPMAIMQASSTQNDLVTASILLSTIYLGFKKSWWLFGLAIGLGMLTKNTYGIFALPFCVYFGIKWLKEYKLKVIKPFLWFLSCVIFINAMHWYRNYQEFSSPVGPKHMSEKILNNNPEIKIFTSNVIRNIGLQIGLPYGKYNSFIDKVIYESHEKLDLSINDQRNSSYSMTYQTQFSIHEDLAGNFLLTILLISSFLFIFREKQKMYYGFTIIGGWIIFNYLLKWQPWGSRLLLPWLLVSIPLIASVLNKLVKNNIIMFLLISILLFCSWPFVAGSSKYFGNFPATLSSNRQILPLPEFSKESRFKRYFYSRNALLPDLESISKIIENNETEYVGLNLGYDSTEYIWWVILKRIDKNINIKIVKSNFWEKNSKPMIIFSDEKQPEEIGNIQSKNINSSMKVYFTNESL